MGTNYYAYFDEDRCTVCGGSGKVTNTSCPHCGQPHEETVECGACYGVGYGMEYHIGKSSSGRVFSLRGHAAGCGASLHGIHSWPEWKGILQQPSVLIRDEYRREITLESLTEIVESRGAWQVFYYEFS